MARDRRPGLRAIDGGKAPAPVSPPAFEARIDYSLEAEGAVLSSLLIEGTLLDEVRVFLRDEHFYSEAHRRIYEAACLLRDAGTPVDVVTVSVSLRERGRLEQVGGRAYLTDVLNAAPVLSRANVVAYARTVQSTWVRRQMRAVSDKASARCAADDTSIEEIVKDAIGDIETLGEELSAQSVSASAMDVVKRTAKMLADASKPDARQMPKTGFVRLDRLILEIPDGVSFLAGRPGMGKTALSAAIALNVAESGLGVYVQSLEVKDEMWMMRAACMLAGVELQRARTRPPSFTPMDWQKLHPAMARIAAMPLWVDQEAQVTVRDLWASARRTAMALSREGKRLGLVVIDYMQLLGAPRDGMNKREEVVSENGRLLLAMSRDLDCSVLALAQLNRENKDRKDKRPLITDLRESGELEAVAEDILLLYRDEYYDKHSRHKGIAEIIVGKQRNGPPGTTLARFDGEYVRFSDLPEDYRVPESSYDDE
jgi:replicative DNA helicase